MITEPFTSNAGSFLVARVENSEHVALDNFNEYKYVRHKDCLYFVEKDVQLCKACADYANNRLSVFRWREENLEPEEKKRRTSDSSHVNYRYLSKEELVERLTNIQKKKKEVICKLTQANEKIKERINVQGVGVNDEQHGVLQDIITSPESKFEFDEETPQWLLWQQQKLQASKKNSKGMRWHPLIIRY